jgi:hypothetical protein
MSRANSDSDSDTDPDPDRAEKLLVQSFRSSSLSPARAPAEQGGVSRRVLVNVETRLRGGARRRRQGTAQLGVVEQAGERVCQAVSSRGGTSMAADPVDDQLRDRSERLLTMGSPMAMASMMTFGVTSRRPSDAGTAGRT